MYPLRQLGGDGRVVVKALVDGSAAQSFGTFTNTSKSWLVSALNGTVVNNLAFQFQGTQSSLYQQGVYGVRWEGLEEPQRLTYLRTPLTTGQSPDMTYWDVGIALVETYGTGSILGTRFVEGTAVATQTISTPCPKKSFALAYPLDTFGYSGYTIWNASTGVTFKLYDDHSLTRPEPSDVTQWRSEYYPTGDVVLDGVLLDVWVTPTSGTGTLGVSIVTDNGGTVNVSTPTLTSTSTQRMTRFISADPSSLESLYANQFKIVVLATNATFRAYEVKPSLRKEPEFQTLHITEKVVLQAEAWWQSFTADIAPAATTTATVFVENVAVGTYTITPSGTTSGLITANENLRDGWSFALPSETYGQSAYIKYTGRFKHYATLWDKEEEPNRLLFHESPVHALPSENYDKLWIAEINPLGGSVVGVCVVDGVAISTQTLTGTLRKKFELSLPLLSAGKTIKATYTSSTQFKHYGTDWQFTPKPFGQTTWFVEYRKPGGASTLDMGRFYSFDLEAPTNTKVVSVWYADGVAYQTNTLTLTQTDQRQWFDRVALPPGMRGRLFYQTLTSTAPIKIWKANLDIDQVGIKGLSRTTIKGVPSER